MSIEENKAIARRWNDEIWSKGNLPAIDELFAADYVCHYPGNLTPDRESYKQWVAMNFAAFADVQCTIEDLVAE